MSCTDCTDVYVGPLWLRDIYLPKDPDVAMEFSGELYLKYVAFGLLISGMDQHGKALIFTSAILLSQPQLVHKHHLPPRVIPSENLYIRLAVDLC